MKTETCEDNIKMHRREIGEAGLYLSRSGNGQMAESCEYGDEPSGSIKCWEFLEWLSNWWLRKKELARAR
jgi:hypothetical protein